MGLAQYFHVEMFLPAKVVIDRGGVDSGKVANLPRRRTFETLFGEYDAGSLEQPVAGPMVRRFENLDTCQVFSHFLSWQQDIAPLGKTVKYKFKIEILI